MTPTHLVPVRHRLFFGLLAASLAACSSPRALPSSCEISTKVTLPSTPLTTALDLQIQRAGEGFLLTRNSGTPLARSSKLGEVGPIVDPAYGDYTRQGYVGLGVVGKDSPADQIVAVGWGVVAAVIDEQTGLPGSEHTVLTAGYEGRFIEVGMGSSLDGRRAIYAHGNTILEDPQVIVLGGDAERRADPIVVKTGPRHPWSCLGVIPTPTAGAVSVVESRDAKRFWHLVELDAEGAQVFESSVDITEDIRGSSNGCPSYVAVTKGGFVALFGGAIVPPKVVAIDRATVNAAGATRVTLSDDEEPAARAFAIAAMDDGYAVYLTDVSGAPRIRLFETSGDAFAGDIVIPAGLDIKAGLGRERWPHSAAGALTLTFRESEGRWGWLEATCGEE